MLKVQGTYPDSYQVKSTEQTGIDVYVEENLEKLVSAYFHFV